MKCAYDCPFHKGKIEWHHPIKVIWHCGFDLCEAHHSLLKGRKVRYSGEVSINKTNEQMRNEIKEMERKVVRQAGYNPDFDIDKY